MTASKRASLLIVFLVFCLLLPACGEDSTPEPQAAAPAPAERATPVSGGKVQPPADGPEWLVMLYQDADDEVLEQDIFMDLNEAENAGSSEAVTVVAQIDRLDGGYDGGEDWTTARRYLVQPDESGDLETLTSEELEDLGEVDMGDPQTLVDFATWAIQNYPARKYALILSDHGSGWPGGWSDDDPNEGSSMSMDRIDTALGEIIAQTGIGAFDLLGFDACLMSQLEALSAAAPYARYAVASEETEPSLGWAYSSFLGALAADPGMDGAALAKEIVTGYIVEDWRITDDAARAALVAESFNRAGKMSASQVAREFASDITLTAVDLSQIKPVNAALNELALALEASGSKQAVAQARARAQSFESVFGEDTRPPYIDLGHFAQLVAENPGGDEVTAAADRLQRAIAGAVLDEKHGPDRPGSTGFSFYFPTSKLYGETSSPGWLHYGGTADRFAAASLWDDFLAYHYAGEAIDPNAADLTALDPLYPSGEIDAAAAASVPPAGAEIEAPGAGQVEFTDFTLSDETIAPDGTATLSVEIQGEGIAYIYIYTAYYDPDSESYLTMDLDFLDAGQVREVGGVIYPDWAASGNPLAFEYDWQPAMTLLSDGKNDTFAASSAETYAETDEETTYQVWGSYQVKGAKKARDGYLRFDAAGNLKGVFVFNGKDGQGAPREVTPQKGDRFTPQEEWLSYDSNGEGEYSYYDGETLTFGKDGFTLLTDTAWAGQYSVGLIVEDFDGQTYEQYLDITVEE